jgi:hypothetical protein
LQVLRDQEKDPEGDRDAQRICGEGRTERTAPEQSQVDEGVGERPLTTNEQNADRETGEHRKHRSPAKTVRRELLQPVDQGKHGDDREAGADEI